MTLDLDAICARTVRHAHAMGPGGEKAWVAGLLAADVPALLAEIERLTAAYAELARNLADARLALARVMGERDDALKTIRALVDHPEPSGTEARRG